MPEEEGNILQMNPLLIQDIRIGLVLWSRSLDWCYIVLFVSLICFLKSPIDKCATKRFFGRSILLFIATFWLIRFLAWFNSFLPSYRFILLVFLALELTDFFPQVFEQCLSCICGCIMMSPLLHAISRFCITSLKVQWWPICAVINRKCARVKWIMQY